MSTWNLQEGVALANEIEKVLIPEGYHCSLGGSVLHRGYSDKDVDIFIYPHTTKCEQTVDFLLCRLCGAGVEQAEKRDHSGYDDKCVWMGRYNDKRVDIFFVK